MAYFILLHLCHFLFLDPRWPAAPSHREPSRILQVTPDRSETLVFRYEDGGRRASWSGEETPLGGYAVTLDARGLIAELAAGEMDRTGTWEELRVRHRLAYGGDTLLDRVEVFVEDTLDQVDVYERDSSGRLVRVRTTYRVGGFLGLGDEEKRLAYDSAGRLASLVTVKADDLSREAGRTELRYDSLGRLTEAWIVIAGAAPHLISRFHYDGQGRWSRVERFSTEGERSTEDWLYPPLAVWRTARSRPRPHLPIWGRPGVRDLLGRSRPLAP